MEMNVSKGQFDRTTKLLEQKIRENSNNLIDRLHAETEAFIEQLKQTSLDIDDLRQQIIDAGGETEDIEERLTNLVTSFENYRANMSRIDAAFDANGQFDGSKIQPLTVDTAALSVGQRSQQLTLSGIKFEVANYDINGNQFIEQGSSTYETGRGKLKYNAGQLFHYGFGTETNGPKVYSIAASSLIMSTTDLYYIYAKLPKSESNTALISIDTRQITVEGKNNGTIIDNNNYYIQLGYISIELSSSNGIYKKSRKVDMTYGQTTINGRLITTGRIEGNGTYFDLDQGEIGGTINFTENNTSSLLNFLKTSKTQILYSDSNQAPQPVSHTSGGTTYYTIDTTGWQSDTTGLTNAFYITIYYEEELVNSVRRYTLINVSEPTKYVGDIIQETDIYFISNKKEGGRQGGTIMADNFTTSTNYNNALYYYVRKNNSPIPSGCYSYTKNNVEYICNYGDARQQGLAYEYDSNLVSNIYDDDENYLNKWNLQLCKPSIDYFVVLKGRLQYKMDDNNNIIIYEIYDVKVDLSATTNAIALKGNTTIAGGLILSQKILCGSGSATAGMCGIAPYSFFAGSSTLNDSLPVYIKNTGAAKFGKLLIDTDGTISSINTIGNTTRKVFKIDGTTGNSNIGEININGSSGIVSFEKSPLSINSDEYDFSNAYEGASVTFDIASSSSSITRSTVTTYIGTDSIFMAEVEPYFSTGSQYSVSLLYYSTSTGTAPTHTVELTSVTSSPRYTVRAKALDDYVKILVTRYSSSALSGLSVSNGSRRYINAGKGLTIYQNGIVISNGSSVYIFFGYKNGDLYTFILKTNPNNTIDRMNFDVS